MLFGETNTLKQFHMILNISINENKHENRKNLKFLNFRSLFLDFELFSGAKFQSHDSNLQIQLSLPGLAAC